jgi:hypothetical protein
MTMTAANASNIPHSIAVGACQRRITAASVADYLSAARPRPGWRVRDVRYGGCTLCRLVYTAPTLRTKSELTSRVHHCHADQRAEPLAVLFHNLNVAAAITRSCA